MRLTVDATLEPVWQIISERADEPRTISNRDRALFGLVRLAGDDARHLAWGQGSILSRLTGDSDEAAARLGAAYKAARDSANLSEIEALANAAGAAERFARSLGAYVESSYGPGLELGRGGVSTGSIALHDGGVPLRLAGLGSRRLATLAIQKSAIAEGAIVLVDEIEHGLEPHRVMGAISQLRADQARAQADGKPNGQILLTTHSEVAFSEAGAPSLRVCRTSRPDRVTTIVKPGAPEPIRALMRHAPRALFSRRIMISEGMTEVGILNGAREFWPPLHSGMPIEHVRGFIADGNGAEAPAIALGLRELGFDVALYRDSDTALPQAFPSSLPRLACPSSSTVMVSMWSTPSSRKPTTRRCSACSITFERSAARARSTRTRELPSNESRDPLQRPGGDQALVDHRTCRRHPNNFGRAGSA
ncbi:ATP-dependent nuclease [Ramlibacter rhizophilus]|uniref:ATP-dependent nuclease n=1 Tax=Ramlibacter rhizophilus TaxID=1781167 RepID=UPI00143237BE|nr:AAA family ATPase [Ramlibacter rhizophilus]